jgi:hypothetical protein
LPEDGSLYATCGLVTRAWKRVEELGREREQGFAAKRAEHADGRYGWAELRRITQPVFDFADDCNMHGQPSLALFKAATNRLRDRVLPQLSTLYSNLNEDYAAETKDMIMEFDGAISVCALRRAA